MNEEVLKIIATSPGAESGQPVGIASAAELQGTSDLTSAVEDGLRRVGMTGSALNTMVAGAGAGAMVASSRAFSSGKGGKTNAMNRAAITPTGVAYRPQSTLPYRQQAMLPGGQRMLPGAGGGLAVMGRGSRQIQSASRRVSAGGLAMLPGQTQGPRATWRYLKEPKITMGSRLGAAGRGIGGMVRRAGGMGAAGMAASMAFIKAWATPVGIATAMITGVIMGGKKLFEFRARYDGRAAAKMARYEIEDVRLSRALGDSWLGDVGEGIAGFWQAAKVGFVAMVTGDNPLISKDSSRVEPWMRAKTDPKYLPYAKSEPAATFGGEGSGQIAEGDETPNAGVVIEGYAGSSISAEIRRTYSQIAGDQIGKMKSSIAEFIIKKDIEAAETGKFYPSGFDLAY